ncbi:hypothetical protein E2562_033968 [Oryza meyeriana var. granulata]|uniref:Uncharacterized protein n=1 Tax=Oryza meyeriana var. granulata TaxID=110450 RepID=A0A6G1C1P5_9ORYZ|nr:hypothetical protein E2562_033968 [Oryza meyeriana var. granulata]
MVVHVVYRRRESGWRGGETSARVHQGAAAISNPPGKHLVRLAGRAVGSSSLRGGAALSPAVSSGRPGTRAGGRTLRAASPPPPCSIASVGCWESRSLRLDGDEDWEEVIALGDDALGADAAAFDAVREAADEHGVFGAPPTDQEVRAAVASIQQVFENHPGLDSDAPAQALALPPISGLPPSGMFVNYFAEDSTPSINKIDQLANLEHPTPDSASEEWVEPALLALNSTALLTREHRNVLDAFHLLQVDPSVQKMVMALSTDKSVWDAVMKNEVVQEFRRSFQDAKDADLNGSSSASPGMMKWVMENIQAKITEFLENILKLVNMLFQAESKDYDLYDDTVRMSFMLTVFVFIVVTMARIK